MLFPADHLYQFEEKSVYLFVKDRVHKIGNKQTDGRTDVKKTFRLRPVYRLADALKPDHPTDFNQTWQTHILVTAQLCHHNPDAKGQGHTRLEVRFIELVEASFGRVDFCRATLRTSAAYAVARCLSVCSSARPSVRPSVTFVYYVETNLQILSTIG